ncbi:MAG: hypothetical protein ACKO45_12135 [Cyanobium sp.]
MRAQLPVHTVVAEHEPRTVEQSLELVLQHLGVLCPPASQDGRAAEVEQRCCHGFQRSITRA